MAAIANAIMVRKILPGQHPPRTWVIHLLLVHRGIVDEADAHTARLHLGSLLDNRDLHSTLLRNRAGDVMRQRDNCRFHTGLVTRRRVHVTNL